MELCCASKISSKDSKPINNKLDGWLYLLKRNDEDKVTVDQTILSPD